MEDPKSQHQLRPGGADGSRKLRLQKKAEGEKVLAQMMIAFGWLLTFSFVVTVCFNLFSINHKSYLSNHGVDAKAVVENVEIVSHKSKSGRLNSYSVTIEASYTATDQNTRPIEGSKRYSKDNISDRPRVGDSIVIKYNPNDPSDYSAIEWNEDPEWFLISFLLVFGIANIYLGRNYEIFRYIRP